MIEYSVEEILELIWTLRESGEFTIDDILKASEEEDTPGILERMKQKGLITRDGTKISMTDQGLLRAQEIVRRHRLAECLLTQLFELEETHIESSACKFEHVLSDKVTESVCTFLGHPPFCPHNKPIPRGDCCKKFTKDVSPLVIRLSDASLGDPYRIVFIMPRQKKRLERLSSIGLLPGTSIKLLQKKPSFVIEIEETMIAVDQGIADEIYVKRV
ncbi:MAG: DtxR family transcriptional regulator [Deltaproteobacteria bacterium]|nr:DtxR family transcriptional regulator [Deltaproteobacteria bacterium]NIS76992.1 DtxR family transcriptional regulator [Deltaproteobacteria bacterium]